MTSRRAALLLALTAGAHGGRAIRTAGGFVGRHACAPGDIDALPQPTPARDGVQRGRDSSRGAYLEGHVTYNMSFDGFPAISWDGKKMLFGRSMGAGFMSEIYTHVMEKPAVSVVSPLDRLVSMG